MPQNKLNLVAGMYARDLAKKQAAGSSDTEPDINDKLKYQAFGDDYDEQSPTKKKPIKPGDISNSIKKYTDE